MNPIPALQSAVDTDRADKIASIRAGKPLPKLPTPAAAVADGAAALRFVRSNAVKYGVDPKHVGMVGLSAGVMPVPASVPSMFVTLASDDPLFGRQGFGLVQGWQTAGRPVELHFHQKGGHGYGMVDPAQTTSDWKGSLLHWLRMNGFLTA